MGKSFRYDEDASGNEYMSKQDIRRARKEEKRLRRNSTRQDERMDGGSEESIQPFDVMSTIDPNDY